jgi:hypothetical protein
VDTLSKGESALPKGRSVEGAPGWRVIERPPRRPWRAGYVIVPIAIMLGLFQILTSSSRDGIGWSEDRQQQAPAPQAPESLGQSARREVPPLPSARPLAGSAGATDEAAGSLVPAAICVSILHTAGAGNALPAIQLAAYLQTRGFAVTDIRAVDVEIERPAVRYFSESDRPATRRLVAVIDAFFAKAPGKAPAKAADFSHVSPKPPQGSVEVWLPPSGADESHSA